MSVHLDVQIAEAMLAHLRDINTAASYHYTVKPESVTADPQEILLVPAEQLPFFLLVFPDVGGNYEYYAASQRRDQIPGVVLARVDVQDTVSPGVKLKAAGDLLADIERALIGPDDDRGQLDGLVVDTKFTPGVPLYGLGSDPIVIVRQPFLIRRHRTYGRPAGE